MDHLDVVFKLGLEQVLAGLSLLVCKPVLSELERNKVKQLVKLFESLLVE